MLEGVSDIHVHVAIDLTDWELAHCIGKYLFNEKFSG
jgi:hypothetical protein